LALSAGAVSAQQVSLGRWAAEQLAPGAKIGVNDAGAIAFFSGRATFDVVGLTTRGEARYWVGGTGSRFEHYEHLSRAELPTHFIVYPEWFDIPQLLGDELTERRVDGATILGGPLMVAYRADLSSLGSGAEPTLDTGSRRIVDELDVADLDSEAAHGYVLGVASAQDDVVEELGGRVDGGRARRTQEVFQLGLKPDGLLILRLSVGVAAELSVSFAGSLVGRVPVQPGSFQEVALSVPHWPGVGNGDGGRSGKLVLQSSQPVTVLHYWSFGRVL
jgi:hypothetical protein